MELFLRLLAAFVKIIYLIVYPLLGLLLPRRKHQQLPPIKNELLTQSLVFLIHELKTKKLKSQTLVAAYIARIREVEPLLHAVVEPRYAAALEEAQRADALIAKATGVVQLQALFAHYPLLGIPFTVKESCGVKGMTHIVGSLERIEQRCAADGQVVSLLRAAGGIPLLVSANPEYCFSIETQAHTQSHQKCQNAYDARRTAGGSSGGEGALNGAGATPFGIGSDIAGSIRIPCLFNGIFGHKPTGGITALQGHFPSANAAYLQLGPMTRFGRDLGLLLQIMAGDKAASLNLLTPVVTKEIKIYYALGFDGLNGWLHSSVCYDMKLSIMKAARYFAQMGVVTAPAKIVGFRNSTEIAFSAIARMKDLPYLMETEQKSPLCATLWEYMRSLCGRSSYTKEGLLFELLRRAHGFMPERCLEKYEAEAKLLKEEIIQLLGSNGVLFFPTFHVPAVHHHSSVLPLWGIDYTLIFNVLGLPATHIPMGLDESGLPIGFQVIAAPLQDRLCLQIAGELELGFGGWVPATKHEFETKNEFETK